MTSLMTPRFAFAHRRSVGTMPRCVDRSTVFDWPTCIVSMAAIFGLLFTLQQSASADDAHDANWPSWRGPRSTGASPSARPPVRWSETKNVRWKTPLPGRGHSTPIVWGNRIFLTTAVPYGDPLKRPRYSGAPGAHDNSPITHHHDFVALAVDRKTGKIVWRRSVGKALPHEGGHISASLASNSAVTDGESVFVSFGSRGLYRYTMDGKQNWKVAFANMQTKHGHGEGSSPVLHDDTLIVNWDHEGASFIAAYDKRTGDQRWRVERDEVTSWATPIVIEHEGRAQLIVSGTSRVRSYDPKTGKVLWECGGMSANIVASPVSADGMVFAGSSYEKRALLAIRLSGARGDITDSDHVVWNRFRGTPYVPSPLLSRGGLYFLTHYQGILSRVNAKTGEDTPGAMRLPGLRNIYASPVAADGRVYITDRNGNTLVIADADRPEPLAMNRLNDRFNASAALAGGEMFLRGEESLYCLAEE